MNKDEFVQKYLNCKSETEKACLIWDLFKIHRPEKLDEALKKNLPMAPYPSDNFNDLLKRNKIYC